MQKRADLPSKDLSGKERLLYSVAQQIKLPLMQIARKAELARLANDPLKQLDDIELTADTAIKLLDNYLLSLQLERTPESFLEPVALSGVLYDVAHELESYAKQYDCALELHMSGKYEPVIANRFGLQAALASLGYVFIEAQSARAQDSAVIKLAAHRGKRGIVAGAYASMEGLSNDIYRRGRQLFGVAGQPLGGFTAGSGAGVFVAESLLSTMSAQLRVSRHQKLSGLAATLASSRQLNLV